MFFDDKGETNRIMNLDKKPENTVKEKTKEDAVGEEMWMLVDTTQLDRVIIMDYIKETDKYHYKSLYLYDRRTMKKDDFNKGGEGKYPSKYFFDGNMKPQQVFRKYENGFPKKTGGGGP